jgi:pimeloyl-ACP methyl ester carboxylesterase
VQVYQRSGLTFDVRDGGPADGEPVVLLHGFPQDSTSWRLVEPSLHAAGLRTLAPDQRGYSPGARPPRRGDYRISELVDDVLALLDAAGLGSAHVVGHDWGGAVAWQLAGRHPERVRSLTVLSTPHPQAIAVSMRSGSQRRKSWYILFFQLPLLPELVAGRMLETSSRRSGLPAEFAAHNAERMRQLGALTATLNWYRAIPLNRDEPRLPSTVPTTFVWGRNDAYLGREAAEATADFVKAPYRFVELDASHWLPETHPAEVATLITERVSAP